MQTYNIKNAVTAINGQLLCDIELFKEQLDIFSKNECSTMLLSEENLFCYLNRENLFLNIDELWQLLSNYDVKIIVYFRKSVEYIASLWKENVKLRHVKSLKNHLETSDYAESLVAVYNLLTRVKLEDIIVRTFEPTRWLNHNLIDDFLSLINIENTDEFLPLQEKQNISFSRDYCERILYVNQYLKERAGTEDIHGINKMIRAGDNPQAVLESLPDEMIKKIADKYYPLECKIAKKFLGRDELFLTKYPAIYQTKRPAYQLNITSREMKELWSVTSYGLRRQILKKQKLHAEKLQKTLTQQELIEKKLLQLQEKLLESRFFYILSKPLFMIFNIIFYKSTREYIRDRLLRR